MQVREIMTRDVASCQDDASLADAARIMLANDCGIVPVLESGTGRLCGVVTDRDVCVGALTKGTPIRDIPVTDSMARELQTCRPEDDVAAVHDGMRRHRVHRIPVVDEEGRPAGIVSLNDLALQALRAGSREAARLQRDVARTLGAICEHRTTSAADMEAPA